MPEVNQPTDEQIAEVVVALAKAREAKATGDNPKPFYDKAEELMRRYGVGEEIPVDEHGEPL